MSEDWKGKGIQPYLKGKPANWSDTDNDWVAFKGNEKLEKELASIKQKQTEILDRLDKPIDTQVTGSNAELINITKNDVEAGAQIRVLDYDFDIKEYFKFYITARTLGKSWDVMVRFQPSETDVHITRTYKEDIEREFFMEVEKRSNFMTVDFTNNSNETQELRGLVIMGVK